MSYEHDRVFTDRFIPELKRLIGPFAVNVASVEQDINEATDLVILTGGAGGPPKIASRVRRPKYADRYQGEVTIRSRRANGVETELSKIMKGWGDWLFYGHSTGNGLEIAPWYLLDLHAFRTHITGANSAQIWQKEITNRDGTFFRAYRVRTFPLNPPLVIGQWEHDVVRTIHTPIAPTAKETDSQLVLF